MTLRPVPCVVLAVVAGALVGCRQDAREPAPAGPGNAEPARADAPLPAADRHTTPDGATFVATFPGRPVWDDVPKLDPPVKGFVWPGDDTHRPHAAWVTVIPAALRERRTARELAIEYGQRAAGVDYAVHTEQTPDGVWVGGWHTGQKELQGHVTTWPQFRPTPGAGAGKAFVVGDKAYSFRVAGPGVEYDDPEFAAFCASVRFDELKGRPPAPPIPDDDLRPLARVAAGSAAFVPGRGAVLVAGSVNTSKGPGDPPAIRGHVARYKYPSFQPDGVYNTPDYVALAVADAPRNRLYLVDTPGKPWPAFGGPQNMRVARCDVPESAADPKETVPFRVERSLTVSSQVTGLALAADGKTAFVLHFTPVGGLGRNVELLRVETDGMTTTGTVVVDGRTWGVFPSPDGRAVYALADAGPEPGTANADRRCYVQEIDTNTWKLWRAFTVRGGAPGTCGPDGNLYLRGNDCLVRVTPPDPAAEAKPAIRLLDAEDSEGSLVVSPDGKRLYITPEGGPVYATDLKDLTEFNRWVIAPESANTRWKRMQANLAIKLNAPGADKLASYGVISPDGKCLFLSSGHAFWLTGAGPEPGVDPAVRWVP